MCRPTATPERPARAKEVPQMLVLRVGLLLAYPVFSHIASLYDDGRWATAALASLVVLVLLDPLLQRRWWAWSALPLAPLGLYWLASSNWTWMLLLVFPVVFTLLVAWGFARTLRAGRAPLVTRIVIALHHQAGMSVSADVLRYTRMLTLAWALLLALLAAINFGLALCAVPDGILAKLGYHSRLAVSHEAWSWFANLAFWGLIGGFAMVEYALRRCRFDEHPYRNIVDFGVQLARLGPSFWRDLLR